MGLNLEITLGKIKLNSPLILCSGIFGFGNENIKFIDERKIGAIVTKTITYEPWPGNPQPRIYETNYGMINRIGLQNPGVFYFMRNIFPKLRKKYKRVFVSISGRSEKEFVEIIKIVSKKRIDAIELNLSCPNFENEKKMISQSSELTFKIVKSVKNETDIPVIVKLTPNVTEIKEIAISAEEGGADILSLINTIKGLAVDFKKMRVIDGGLSGPSIKPVGLKCVYDVYKVVNIPIIGMGGITCGLDAIEYFLVGASAIGIGSGFYSNPQIIDDIYKTLKNFLRKNKFKSIREMIGLLNEKKENF